jgi:hypothetical protein
MTAAGRGPGCLGVNRASRLFISCAIVASTHVHAQDPMSIPGLIGTIYAKHERHQTAGMLEGCAINFSVIFQDHVYRQGRPAMAQGAVVLYVTDPAKPYLALKLGVSAVGQPKAAAEVPALAYLQSESGNTAVGMKWAGESPDYKGFGLWVAGITNESAAVLQDILSGVPFSVGFNRTQNGRDVLVSVDVHVVDTNLDSSGSFERRRSDETVVNFARCFSEATTKQPLPGK